MSCTVESRRRQADVDRALLAGGRLRLAGNRHRADRGGGAAAAELAVRVLHRIDFTLEREGRIGREVLRAVFQVVRARQRHAANVGLATAQYGEGQSQARAPRDGFDRTTHGPFPPA